MANNFNAPSNTTGKAALSDGRLLKVLTAAQVRKIDEILGQIGPFGEVRLIKSKGKLRFITTVETEDAIRVRNEDSDQSEDD